MRHHSFYAWNQAIGIILSIVLCFKSFMNFVSISMHEAKINSCKNVYRSNPLLYVPHLFKNKKKTTRNNRWFCFHFYVHLGSHVVRFCFFFFPFHFLRDFFYVRVFYVSQGKLWELNLIPRKFHVRNSVCLSVRGACIYRSLSFSLTIVLYVYFHSDYYDYNVSLRMVRVKLSNDIRHIRIHFTSHYHGIHGIFINNINYKPNAVASRTNLYRLKHNLRHMLVQTNEWTSYLLEKKKSSSLCKIHLLLTYVCIVLPYESVSLLPHFILSRKNKPIDLL